MNRLLTILKTSLRTSDQQNLALVLLLTTGLLLGITTNLAKVAHSVSLSPLTYLTWSLLGASLMLFFYALLKGQMVKVNRRSIEYFLIAGFLTTAGANLIFFNAVNELGVSFVAMMIALPPLFTYAGMLLLRKEQFCCWRMAGVLMALTGTALLVAKQWSLPEPNFFWIAITFAGPVLLAAGNIYRTYRWPPKASPESLAPGMLFAGTWLLCLYSVVTGEVLLISSYSTQKIGLIVLQSLIFSGQFFLMFKLQKIGGPVFLSLMGGVSAIFSVPIAMAILGEPAAPGFAVSAVLIIAAIISNMIGNQACNKPELRAV